MAHKGTPPTPPTAILRPENEDACLIHLQEMDHIPPVVMNALRLAGIQSYKRLTHFTRDDYQEIHQEWEQKATEEDAAQWNFLVTKNLVHFSE